MKRLIENEWYWVRVKNDYEWYPAKYSKKAAGGWTNEDTWEDFDNEVVDWIRIPSPQELALR